MPNWSHNSCTVTGTTDDIEALFDLMVNRDGQEHRFDFNRILPMPECLGDYDVTLGAGGKHIPIGPTNEEMAVLATRYGATNWYDWCCENWGTKWNAHDFYRDGTRFGFDTAWCSPVPVFVALARRFPKLRFLWQTVHEDNCWAGPPHIYICFRGRLMESKIPTPDEEAAAHDEVYADILASE